MPFDGHTDRIYMESLLAALSLQRQENAILECRILIEEFDRKASDFYLQKNSTEASVDAFFMRSAIF